MFVIIVGSLFTVLNIYNIYGNTFGNWNKGIVLFHYTIQGESNSSRLSTILNLYSLISIKIKIDR
jgi:hypothetical protein